MFTRRDRPLPAGAGSGSRVAAKRALEASRYGCARLDAMSGES
jgi:hypothetical protein